MNTLELLEHLGEVEPVDLDLLGRTAAVLDDAAAAASTPPPRVAQLAPVTARTARRARRVRRSWIVRTASIAAAVALLGGIGVVVRPGTTAGPTSAAAAELRQLAQVAAAQPATAPPGPGQYQYTESEEAYTSSTYDVPGGGYTVSVPEERQIWIGPDGSGRLAETFGQPDFLSPQDRADWVAAGSPSLAEAPSDTSFGPGGLSDGPGNLSTLPTDPTELGAMLSARKIEGGPPGAAEDFVQIGDLLRETDASPALRAALYQVASNLPGVILLGAVTDHAGRAGVGLAFDSAGTEHELIFSQATGALLGEEDTTVATGASEPVGTVDDWVVYLSSEVVDSTGAGMSTTPAPPSDNSGSDAPTPATGAALGTANQ
ncbi:MAG TPA: CU044_5270 family protein [Acidimicrobiales bacterium]|jgi:hypothetical protein